MAHGETTLASQASWTDAQRAEIAEETQRILANPRFGSSHRCAKLLKHIVRHALDGNCEVLKERTLGIEVFGREVNYDTSADPVVRITASEIRKRLALYYQVPEHVHSVRIQLLSGGYIPTFLFGESDQPLDAVESWEAGSIPKKDSAPGIAGGVAARKASRIRLKWALIGLALVAVLAALFLVPRLDTFQNTRYLVWKPLLETNRDIVVCVSDLDMSGSTNRNLVSNVSLAGESAGATAAPLLPLILLEDARTAHKISNQLTQFGHLSTYASVSELSLRDLRGTSVVLVGGLNNPWSMRLLSNLRFGIRMDAVRGERWVQDAHNPTSRDWMVGGNVAQSNLAYAVLTRFWSAETGSWIMAMTGTGPLGVEAAADLITAPAASTVLPDSLRSARNFQVVLKATVVNGAIGSPQILSVHIW
jgi:hypothetical protein